MVVVNASAALARSNRAPAEGQQLRTELINLNHGFFPSKIADVTKCYKNTVKNCENILTNKSATVIGDHTSVIERETYSKHYRLGICMYKCNTQLYIDIIYIYIHIIYI